MLEVSQDKLTSNSQGRTPLHEELIKAQSELKIAAEKVTNLIILTHKSPLFPERLYKIDRTTHLLNMITYMTESAQEFLDAIEQAAQGPKKFQYYLFETVKRNIIALPLEILMLLHLKSIPSKRNSIVAVHSMSFVPVETWYWKVIGRLVCKESLFALKVSGALTVLLSMLWSTSSRAFFLQYNVQTSTVPLLLALSPTTGKFALITLDNVLFTHAHCRRKCLFVDFPTRRSR